MGVIKSQGIIKKTFYAKSILETKNKNKSWTSWIWY